MLVLEALRMALKSRNPAPGLIHHSDRGSQYASEKYIRMLEKHDVQISMSRVGMATDNAKREQPARCCLVSKKIESFFGGFKRECVNLLEFESLADVLSSVPEFLDAVYNGKRLHSSLGYLPPVEFDQVRITIGNDEALGWGSGLNSKGCTTVCRLKAEPFSVSQIP